MKASRHVYSSTTQYLEAVEMSPEFHVKAGCSCRQYGLQIELAINKEGKFSNALNLKPLMINQRCKW